MNMDLMFFFVSMTLLELNHSIVKLDSLKFNQGEIFPEILKIRFSLYVYIVAKMMSYTKCFMYSLVQNIIS